jgi:hypothetical protein
LDHKFTLTFKLIKCSRCGVDRIRGVECADCGRSPEVWEIDPGLTRRTVVARRLLAELAKDSPPSTVESRELTILEPPRRAGTWLEQFWSALHAAIDSDFRDPADLEEAIQDLVTLRDIVATMAPVRPFARAVELGHQIALSCAQMAEAYLHTLVAKTPLEAQPWSVQAQGHLDDLAELGSRIEAWMARQDKLSEASSVTDALWSLLSDAMAATGASSLLPLADHMQSRLRDVLEIDVPPDLAIDYAFNAAFADLCLSLDDFELKVKAGVELFLGAGTALVTVIEDPTFQSDLVRLQLELFDSGFACQKVIGEATHLRQEARAIVELQASLVESAGLLLALPLLVAVGQKTASYTTLRQGNATEHVSSAQSHERLSTLLAGLDPHIRTAQGHRAINYGEASLSTDLRSGQREYDYEDLVDSTFEAMESLLAGLLGLRIAAAARGITLLEISGLQSLGMTQSEIAEFVLGALGQPEGSVTIGEGMVSIDLPINSLIGLTPALGATLTSLQLDSSCELCVSLNDGIEWHSDTGTYADFRDATDDFQKQVALMRVQASWRSADGSEWMPPDVVKKWTATQMSATIGLAAPEQFKRLRLLREFATELGALDVETAVRGFTRWARLALLGDTGGDVERESLDRVMAWMTMTVEFDLV